MNQSRSTKKFGFFRKSGRDLLPPKPVDTVPILPWWVIQVGYVTEDDMKVLELEIACSSTKQEHTYMFKELRHDSED